MNSQVFKDALKKAVECDAKKGAFSLAMTSAFAISFEFTAKSHDLPEGESPYWLASTGMPPFIGPSPMLGFQVGHDARNTPSQA